MIGGIRQACLLSGMGGGWADGHMGPGNWVKQCNVCAHQQMGCVMCT